MGIAKSVEALALMVRSHRQLVPWQEQLVAALCSMPVFLADRQLDQWERNVQRCWPDTDDDSEISELLSAVFELGRSNLYSAFNATAGLEALREAEELFERAGISVPPRLDVGRW